MFWGNDMHGHLDGVCSAHSTAFGSAIILVAVGLFAVVYEVLAVFDVMPFTPSLAVFNSFLNMVCWTIFVGAWAFLQMRYEAQKEEQGVDIKKNAENNAEIAKQLESLVVRPGITYLAAMGATLIGVFIFVVKFRWREIIQTDTKGKHMALRNEETNIDSCVDDSNEYIPPALTPEVNLKPTTSIA
jgi:hypothetical protein